MKSTYSILVILFCCPLVKAQDSLAQHAPNVILIVVDDMGWNDVSYHGSEIKTPTIDSLAKAGIELNRFYVHPTCSPTRVH